ncbi:MAG TPA: helix-turn-helix domain-containing protein [Yinghuangia sp.]|uniref:TetR/AcrR family transcriptional regulator n=1 Tax=Yinghuangia sp. YIM S10712 TaxID=3436930 RepID=UPI002CE624B7|nr:helix-turn-helix domain-containing protein [Yinghuangia sp.]
MTRARRGPASQDPRTRDALLRAAAQIMVEEGYAAATSRRVAARAGVKPSLVHYYFPTMDDLFLRLFRDRAEAALRRQRQALASDEPLQALWDLSRDPDGTALIAEFAAFANHRKAIRAELAAHTERSRQIQVEALSRLLREHGVDTQTLPPAAAAFLLQSVSTLLVLESQLGLTTGHAEAAALIDRFLRHLKATETPGAVPPLPDE